MSLQQVITLALVTSCVNIREFLKDTTTADNHEKVAWKTEFTFFQFLSWLFQNAYFVKCKRTLLELISINISKSVKLMNFVIACLRPSQNMKLGIFTGSRAVDGKEMYKKVWCTCKVVVLLIWLSRRRRIFVFLLFTIHCDESKNRIFSGQIDLLLLIASQTFFWLIGSSFVSG